MRHLWRIPSPPVQRVQRLQKVRPPQRLDPRIRGPQVLQLRRVRSRQVPGLRRVQGRQWQPRRLRNGSESLEARKRKRYAGDCRAFLDAVSTYGTF